MQHLLLILLIIATSASAAVINIPDDFDTIQEGIDEADDGDTVLVAPGEYVENIDFEGKAIAIIGDPENPSEVIIDGDRRGSVVTISDVRDGNCLLAGFTIRNGAGEEGGGIHCYSSDQAIIAYCIINDNNARRSGGGIYCERSDHAIIEYCTISDNNAINSGGGVFFYYSDASISNCTISGNLAGTGGGINSGWSAVTISFCTISGNSAEYTGGGVFTRYDDSIIENCIITGNEARIGGGINCQWGSDPVITNCLISGNITSVRAGGINCNDNSSPVITNSTITGNETQYGGAFFCGGGSSPIIVNSILRNNSPQEIYFQEQISPGIISISYSDIEGGEDEIVINDNGMVEWDDGNIDEAPLFVDPDEGDFHLTVDSPCIDAGDPDSPEDPDRTRADMGAFFFYHHPGQITGRVFDSLTGDPIAGALVSSSISQSAISDDEGIFIIENPIVNPEFELTAHAFGFVDSTVIDLHLEFDDTLSIDFHLRRPLFISDVERIEEQVEWGGSIMVEIGLANSGNYPLEWNAARNTAIEAEPWERILSEPVGRMLDDGRLEGAVFAEDHFYVSGSGADPNQIYVLNRDAEFVTSFDQPGEHRTGLYDLAFDGELIWGGDITGEIFGFDREGNVEYRWEGPHRTVKSVAWDSDREVLWISSITGDEIAAYNRFGERVASTSQFSLYVMGMAYWPEDPDGYPLYLMTERDINDYGTAVVYKVDPETSDTIRAAELELQNNGRPRGCFLSDQYIPFAASLIYISSGGEDRLEARFLGTSGLTWMELDEDEGLLEPDAETVLNVALLGEDLESGVYEARIDFDFPEVGGEASIPVMFTVDPVSVSDERLTPVVFAIESIYPNPFNSSAVVAFSLPSAGRATLKLYDLTGREVSVVVDGKLAAGRHTAILSGVPLGSGVYFLQMEHSGKRVVQKITMLK